jgi:hypothetical protein
VGGLGHVPSSVPQPAWLKKAGHYCGGLFRNWLTPALFNHCMGAAAAAADDDVFTDNMSISREA